MEWRGEIEIREIQKDVETVHTLKLESKCNVSGCCILLIIYHRQKNTLCCVGHIVSSVLTDVHAIFFNRHNKSRK